MTLAEMLANKSSQQKGSQAMKSAMTYFKAAAAVSALFALSSVAASAEPAGGGHIDVQGGYDSMAIPVRSGIAMLS